MHIDNWISYELRPASWCRSRYGLWSRQYRSHWWEYGRHWYRSFLWIKNWRQYLPIQSNDSIHYMDDEELYSHLISSTTYISFPLDYLSAVASQVRVIFIEISSKYQLKDA
jgi:hypothetical protein